MSNIEYEAKIYDVDPADIIEKLTNLGAKEVGNYNFCRYVFDTIPAKPDRWVRLRSDGKQATLTVKEITADTIDGTHEWEVEVSDMETTLEILAKIGIKPRGYQENKRQEYDLDGVQVVIDRWPKLKPYVEIEANSVVEVVNHLYAPPPLCRFDHRHSGRSLDTYSGCGQYGPDGLLPVFPV